MAADKLALYAMSDISPELAVQLIDNSLPWDRATQMHIDAFLKRYTLHDSYWEAMQTNCAWADTATAVFRFDPVWNSSVSAPTSFVSDWPLLVIRFNCVSTIRLSGFKDFGRSPRDISDVAVEHISDEEVITVMRDIYGASVSFQHFPLIDVLVMSANEEVIELPAN